MKGNFLLIFHENVSCGYPFENLGMALLMSIYMYTVIILNFRTDRPGQTVQTQEEQSDQSLHCLQFHLHFFDEIS